MNGKGNDVPTVIPLAGLQTSAGSITTTHVPGSTRGWGSHRLAAFGGAAAIALVTLALLFIFYQLNDNQGYFR